ncbi:MAG TPA: hypothetical protein VMA35_16075, partial [Candidatus Sulfopaludibacter sp.]|nr:hypothetical protein [Candidatus Sulfopaludibacter sp.]
SIEEQLIKFGRQSNVPKEKILSAERYEELAQRLTTFGKRPEDAVEHFTLQPLQNNHYLRIQ